MCRAHDLVLNRDVNLYWWSPEKADFAGCQAKLDGCWEAIRDSGDGTTFSDPRFFYLVAPGDEAGKRALDRLLGEGLFVGAPTPPPAAPSKPAAAPQPEPLPAPRPAPPQPPPLQVEPPPAPAPSLTPPLLEPVPAPRPTPPPPPAPSGPTAAPPLREPEPPVSPCPAPPTSPPRSPASPFLRFLSKRVALALITAGVIGGGIYVFLARNSGQPIPSPPSPSSPVIDWFRSSPDTVDPGGTVRLEWKVRNATEVSISPGLGLVAEEGRTDVSTTSSVQYVLAAKGPGGTSTSGVPVTVRKLEQKPRAKEKTQPYPQTGPGCTNGVGQWACCDDAIPGPEKSKQEAIAACLACQKSERIAPRCINK